MQLICLLTLLQQTSNRSTNCIIIENHYHNDDDDGGGSDIYYTCNSQTKCCWASIRIHYINTSKRKNVFVSAPTFNKNMLHYICTTLILYIYIYIVDVMPKLLTGAIFIIVLIRKQANILICTKINYFISPQFTCYRSNVCNIMSSS